MTKVHVWLLIFSNSWIHRIFFFFWSKRNDYLLLMVLNITTVGRLSTCYNTEHTQPWSGSHESVFIPKSWQLCPHTKLHMNVYSGFLKEILGIYSFRCYFLLEYRCFTVLLVLLHSKMNQPDIHIYPPHFLSIDL